MSKKSDIKMKLETIGWLLGFFSLLVLGSLIGHDSSEDPSLTSASINNPFNIVGVYTSYVLVKLGFGYGSYFIPIIGLAISLQLISNYISLQSIKTFQWAEAAQNNEPSL